MKGSLLKLQAVRARTVELWPIVLRSSFYALLGAIPILALLAIGLDAVLPRPDPITGQRAGAWLGPLVAGIACAIYLGLMLGYLYVHRVRKESVPRFVTGQLRKARQRAAAAADRAGVGIFFQRVRARAVGVALIALVPLLAVALLWIGTAALRAVPWWAAPVLVASIVIVVLTRR